MTAIQVINEIKALDPKEQAWVLDSLLEIEANRKITYMDDQCFDLAADRVMTTHSDLMHKLTQ